MDDVSLSNVNSLWGAYGVGELYGMGLRHVVISPGSRSTPLTVAFARHGGVEALPILDERSAGFYALGLARRTGRPVALVCTSGTAAANYLPAVIEARESRTPLLLLTADRPPEMRACSSGQTIDQLKLFGSYVTHFAELALPEATVPALRYLRQTLRYAYERAQSPAAGPVHLNFPFRDPLAPGEGRLDLDGDVVELLRSGPGAVGRGSRGEEEVNGRKGERENGIEGESANRGTGLSAAQGMEPPRPSALGLRTSGAARGLIIVGSIMPTDPAAACEGVWTLARRLGWPVLCDALGPWRTHREPGEVVRVTAYDAIARSPSIRDALRPDFILQIGPLPTSKALRTWLATLDCEMLVLSDGYDNLDPLHADARHMQVAYEQLAAFAESLAQGEDGAYAYAWRQAEAKARQAIDARLDACDFLFEGLAARELYRSLPADAALFLASSMPVRDAEFFAPLVDAGPRVFFSRGANGIDGTLSTALGSAHGGKGVLLTGDLALLHDTNGFLAATSAFRGSLTIVLINNAGGGIFESLPIAKHEAVFERYFATPQRVDFAQLARAYGVEHHPVESIEQLRQRITSLPETGLRLLELRTNRKRDAAFRQEILKPKG